MSSTADQDEIIAFLQSPKAWANPAAHVDVIETHGALVFMAGNEVLKVRRAVRLPYLDFSTIEARRMFAEREVALNAPHAAGLYHGVVAITREADGVLAIDGNGRPIEWAVHMVRFDQEALLSSMAARYGLSEALAKDVADAIYAYHTAALRSDDTTDGIPALVRSILSSIGEFDDARVQAATARLAVLMNAAVEKCGVVRRGRSRCGFVRRCHGDLHLGNIVLWRGRPVPFDALEFDENLATIDTHYDLAFLLMDLDRHEAHQAANIVLNRYLWRSGDVRELDGLAAMPLYLALRASVRARVALDRARLGVADAAATVAAALATLARAETYLLPPAPRLIAIGGLSGSGKTTIAKALAPWIGSSPGAIHLRSDLERKWLEKLEETDRLPDSAYTAEQARVVYERVAARASAALNAGYCVIVDAVFARPAERKAVEAIARAAGCRFTGLWLIGTQDVLKARVEARRGDASDATAAVVERQFKTETGPIDWQTVETTGDIADCVTRARSVLDIDMHQ